MWRKAGSACRAPSSIGRQERVPVRFGYIHLAAGADRQLRLLRVVKKLGTGGMSGTVFGNGFDMRRCPLNDTDALWAADVAATRGGPVVCRLDSLRIRS